MTLESELTERINIRFIDARSLIVEAKLNLDIAGYPGRSDQLRILDEAARIFEERSMGFQTRLQSNHIELENAKHGAADGGSSSSDDISSGVSMSSRRHGSKSPIRNRRQASKSPMRGPMRSPIRMIASIKSKNKH